VTRTRDLTPAETARLDALIDRVRGQLRAGDSAHNIAADQCRKPKDVAFLARLRWCSGRWRIREAKP
jgi:hypothetical protein